MPSSWATALADFRLFCQFWTASSLKVSPNLRGVLTDVSFLACMVHCSPNSWFVNSKQSQRDISLLGPPVAGVILKLAA